ncbi:hypothetical protein FOZ62_025500 [Perkinsus olseni]|uniref:Uncharacterized protein n=1 Tax=Perkinsus olseni TaxID=32597 RepID=A0A7J6QUV8_PEROL|nr:hypothetical protein FOZ62_025500 [Perkinsus olseni]
MYFPRFTLVVAVMAALLTETSAVRLHRKGKGGGDTKPKSGLFSKIFKRTLFDKLETALCSSPFLRGESFPFAFSGPLIMSGFVRRVGPRLMQVNSLRPYGQPVTTKLPYEPWPYDHRYIGMTAREVISKFKVAAFPLKNFPETLLDAKVDEIYQKSAKMRFKSCINAMQLLQKGKYDKVRTIRSEDYYKPPKRPRFFQRLNRMRRSTKLGIKRNGLKRISGLTGKTRDE